MRPTKSTLFGGIFAAFVIAALPPVQGDIQTTGTPGSAHATSTISGKQLPPPDPKFGGVIKDKATESTPWWPPRVVPPKGAPNVLLIMTDDSGFGAPGTFGGVVPTPALDRVAKNGLRVYYVPARPPAPILPELFGNSASHQSRAWGSSSNCCSAIASSRSFSRCDRFFQPIRDRFEATAMA